MTIRRCFLMCLLLLLAVLPVSADICTQSVWRWGGLGDTRAAGLNGSHLYFGGKVLRCAAVSNPESPHLADIAVDLRGLLGEENEVTGIAFDGNNALVALGRDGCALVDLSVPDQPSLVNSYSTTNSGWEVRGAAIMSTMALLGLSKPHDPDTSMLLQLDLGEPGEITEMDSIEVSGQIQAVVVVGRYALLIASGHQADDGSGFRPASLRAYDLMQWHGMVETGSEEFPGAEPIAIVVEEETAYLLDFEGGVNVVDLESPADPLSTDFFDTPAMGWGGIDFEDDQLFVVAVNGLFVVDMIAGPGDDRIDHYEAAGLGPGIAAHDGVAFVTMGSQGVGVIDVHSSDTPVLLETFGSARYASQFAMDGVDCVFADDSVEPAGRAEEILHLSTWVPTQGLRSVGSYVPPGPVHGLVLSDSKYVASINPGWDDGRCGLFASTFGGPFKASKTEQSIDICPLREGSRSIMDADAGVFAVLSDAGAEVHLFDLTAGEWTEGIGVWPASVDVTHLEVSEGRLALCRNASVGAVVDIVDISNLAVPQALDSLQLSGTECLGMDAEGSRLVVATRVPGQPWGSFTDLDVVDLQNGIAERTIERVADTQGVAVALGDNLVHIVEYVGNLAEHRVFDLEATEPDLVDVHLRGTQKTVFESSGENLAWGLGEDGMKLIRFRRCAPPARDYSEGGRAGP